MASNVKLTITRLIKESRQQHLPLTVGAQNTGKNRANIPNQVHIITPDFNIDSPLADFSSSSDSEDELMEVEVRTSGPDSALFSSKIAVEEEEEKEKYLNGQCLHEETSDKKDLPEDGIKASDLDSDDQDTKISKETGLKNCEEKITFSGDKDKTSTDENARNSDLSNDKACKSNSKSDIHMYRLETIGNTKIAELSSDTGESFMATDFNPISTVEQPEIIRCYSPTKSPNNQLDNVTLSKLLQAAFDEREINGETATKSGDSNLHSVLPEGMLGRSEYNTGDFPKLKEMLTKSPVSEATMQFTETMESSKGHCSKVSAFSEQKNDSQFVFASVTGTNNAQSNDRNVNKIIAFPTIRSALSDRNEVSDSFQWSVSPESHYVELERRFESNQGDIFHQSLPLEEQSTAVRCHTPQRIPAPPPLLPPCRVCGEKASGFHYGVNTCEACKGFFRRSLCRKEPYVCVSNGSCQVQSGRRTVCSHCRLKRCLEVGMSKNAIKTGRYTHELRSKNIMEVKHLQQQQKRGITPTATDPVLPKIPQGNVQAFKSEVNEDLQDLVDTLMMAQTYLFEFLDDYYDTDLILKRQMEVYNRYKQEKFDRMRNRANNLGLSESESSSSSSRDLTGEIEVTKTDAPTELVKEQVMRTITEDMERGIQGLVMYAKTVPGFVDLDVDDQSSILKCARFDIWYIGHIRCLNSTLRVGACEWYFHAEELAQVWGQKLVDMAFRLTDYGQKLNLTREETAVLRGVSLTFPDRCILKYREPVEKMHEKMLDCFRYVACKRHPNYNKWLPDVINFLVYLREFAIEFEKRSSKMNLEWPLIQKNPLLLEVFFS